VTRLTVNNESVLFSEAEFLTLNKLRLRFAALGMSGSILLYQRQSVAASVRDKVRHSLAVVVELGGRRNVRLMLRATLARVGPAQLFLFLFCSRVIRNNLVKIP
jgi:hypothetical protein